MAIHPIKTTGHLRDSYIRYLKTIKTFQDPWLREQFANAIDADEALIKGPILEASPPFIKSDSIKDLTVYGILSTGFEGLCSSHLPFSRNLYQHQVEAIQKVVSGRNIVVSTGTGSGKTETFLIPIINHLLLEEEQGTLSAPGVRAMLLYPLNALANDQVKRLRRVLMDYPQITFGRYIGETERTKEMAEDQFQKIYPDEPRITNELLSRSEMHKAPPHIFLTNYAMLEYLLLRPEDSVFFDGDTGKHWSYIVLDEAHIYDGAQANEIGMLIRRLQQRIVGDDVDKLQGIATSATIGGGERDYPEVVKFAQGLFNLPFEWASEDPEQQDVVRATRMPVSALGEVWGQGTPQLYRVLAEMADNWRHNHEFSPPQLSSLGLLPENILNRLSVITVTSEYLFQILVGDENLHRIREELEKEPQNINELTERIFPQENTAVARDGISDLVSAAVLAKDKLDENPLLPARYHVFAKALEGVFVCLNTEEHKKERGKNTPNLFLPRQKTCPHCGGHVFELANCTLCGKAYLIGVIDPATNILEQSSLVYDAVVSEKEINYFVLDIPGVAAINEDQKVNVENTDDEIKPNEDLETMFLCPKCGKIRGKYDDSLCECGIDQQVIYRIVIKKDHKLQRCVSCSTRSNRGVVYRFLTGQDAPVSVLVDALYQDLSPSKKAACANLPGKGRKLLNFTDSRQKAAFFAPFVERTHMRDMRRQIIIQTLLSDPDAIAGELRLPNLVARLTHRASLNGVFPIDLSEDAKKHEVAIWLMKEFSPLDRRISLEGVGLLRFLPAIDPNWNVPDFLTDQLLNMERLEAEALILMLLKTIRMNGAITYLRSDIEDIVADEAFAPRNKVFYVRGYGAKQTRNFNVISWNPAPGYSNARVDILMRILISKGADESGAKDKATMLLKKLWEYLISAYSPWSSVFQVSDQGEEGVLYQLRHDMWRVVPSGMADWDDWFVCGRCLNMSPHNAGNVCGTFGCLGTLVPIRERGDLLEENLYRDAYINDEPIPLSAEEHTAQWVTRKAAEVQSRFIQGEINLLSCSTTFELGVDVGDLQSVVMRNVPPSTANYIQRAGRAGRRTDSPAFVLTFAQRRPHDLNHFQNPKLMVSGEIKPPVTVLNNEKIVRRHLYSVILAAFLRWVKIKHNQEYHDIGSFFDLNQFGDSGVKLLRSYIAQRDNKLLKALKQVLPSDGHLQNYFPLDDWSWLLDYSNEENSGVLDKAEAEYRHEISEFADLEESAANSKNYNLANRYQNIQKQIRKRRFIDYLANRNVLPKYGFPTDVVNLKTDHLQGITQASQVDLSRDLRMAISEFAPGSEVIAAKRIWKSTGVRKLAGRDWEPYQYVVCTECEKMTIKPGESLPDQCACGHIYSAPRFHGTYIVPEHGFVAAKNTSKPGESSPDVFYSSQVFFADYESSVNVDEPAIDDAFGNSQYKVSKRYSKNGWLAVVNNGRARGFNICNYCGFTQPVVSNLKWGKHENPITGSKCASGYTRYHFGHRFMTDVLEIQIDYPFNRNKGDIQSILHAVLVGACVSLGIKRDDLNGTVYYRNHEPAFIIYDNVPGGAGHVSRVYDQLYEVLEGAREVVSDCECGEDTSCYSCLRNYRNQYVHDKLSRGVAERIIQGVLE